MIGTKQRGLTLWSFAFLLVVACSVGILSIKIIPVYLQHSSIMRVVKNLPQNTYIKEAGRLTSKEMVIDMLSRGLYINEVRDLKAKDIFKLERKNYGYLIRTQYDVRVPIVGNVDALIYFNSAYDLQTH